MRLKNKKSVPPLSIGENTFPIIMLWYDLHICTQTVRFCLTAGAIVRVRPQRLLIGSNPGNCNPRSMRRRRVYVLGVALVDDEVVFLTNDTYASCVLVAVVVTIAVFTYAVLCGTTGSHQFIIVLDGVELYTRYDIYFLIHCLNVIVSLRELLVAIMIISLASQCMPCPALRKRREPDPAGCRLPVCR